MHHPIREAPSHILNSLHIFPHNILEMSRIIAVFAATVAGTLLQTTPILNESKRSFYTETMDVSTVPGVASQEDTELLGPRTVVNGMTVRLTPAMEGVFGAARTTLLDAWTYVESSVNDGKNSLYQKEREVSATVRGLHHRSEDLLPNAVYIAIAVLTGQIMARNRSIVAKAVLPVGLGLGAFKYFLPQTFSHTADFVWKAEQKALPGLASTQGAAVEQAEKLAQSLEETAAKSQEKYHMGVETLRTKVIKFTGLNLNEEVTEKKN